MDRFGEWRPIEPAANDDDEKPSSTSVPAKPVEPARPGTSAINVRLIGLLAAGALSAVGAVVWLSTASATPSLEVNGSAGYFDARSAASPRGTLDGSQTTSALIVVDVEGAVVSPGVHRMPAGSRVGDAIAAAGGYSPQVDIAAASSALNLAETLTDGGKVHVPMRGEAAAVSAIPRGPSAIGPGLSGLINVNTATTDQLDTLPGIGPVTAAKIIAAREQTPFATVDELLSREVVGSATFANIKPLITVAP